MVSSKYSDITQVHHGHSGAPAKDPLNVERTEFHGMECYAPSNVEGIRAPFLEGSCVCKRVEFVDRGGKLPHEFLDVDRPDQLHTLSRG